MDAAHDLDLLIRARTPLVAVDSHEELRLDHMLRRITKAHDVQMFVWTVTHGLSLTSADAALYDSKEPLRALAHIETIRKPAVFLLKDMAAYLEDPAVVRKLKDLAHGARGRRTMIVSAPHIEVPPPLAKACARLVLALPTEKELRDLAWKVVSDFSNGLHVDIKLGEREFAKLIESLKGLTLMEAERALAKAVADDLALTADDVGALQDARREILQEAGALEYVPVQAGLASVGGLEGLKAWLAKRRRALDPEAQAFGITPPKGIVLLGVQGCGKSLAAKAIAAEWDVPLLRLEPGRLYDKYIGETDKHLESALRAAEHMAPCVLMIDEIEKGFAAVGDTAADGGLSRRIFGRLLGWLQDRDHPVFVVATCNEVHDLPPELMRKGRFDEVFFIDLPDQDDREAIFRLHLIDRERDPARFDVPRLAEAADGFSGAEIEQAIVSGLYTAFHDEGRLTTEVLLGELAATQPLSVTRAEAIGALRRWAEGRTVSAGGQA